MDWEALVASCISSRTKTSKKIPDLGNLSMWAVLQAFPRLSQQQKSFECLPPEVLTRFVELLKLGRPSKSISLQEVRSLIGGNLERLYLDLYGWRAHDVDDVIKQLANQCHLKMLQTYGPLTAAQLDVGFASLTDLSITADHRGPFCVQDDIFIAIGSSMPNLRRLELFPVEVTGSIGRYLCQDDGTRVFGKCSQLEELTIGQRGKSSFSPGDLVLLLEKLPNFKSFRDFRDPFFILTAISLYAKKHPNAVLPNIIGPITVSGKNYLGIWKSKQSVVPNIIQIDCNVDFYESTTLSSLHLQHQASLVNLELQGHIYFTPECRYNSNLTNLKLRVKDRVDITLITECCPNLKNLDLLGKASENNKFSLNVTLENLKFLDIAGDFPIAALQGLLRSRSLVTVKIGHSDLTDEDLAATFTDNLSQLGEFHIWCNDVISIESIKLIVCLAPRLRTIDINKCRLIESKQDDLVEFLCDNGLNEGLKIILYD